MGHPAAGSDLSNPVPDAGTEVVPAPRLPAIPEDATLGELSTTQAAITCRIVEDYFQDRVAGERGQRGRCVMKWFQDNRTEEPFSSEEDAIEACETDTEACLDAPLPEQAPSHCDDGDEIATYAARFRSDACADVVFGDVAKCVYGLGLLIDQYNSIWTCDYAHQIESFLEIAANYAPNASPECQAILAGCVSP